MWQTINTKNLLRFSCKFDIFFIENFESQKKFERRYFSIIILKYTCTYISVFNTFLIIVIFNNLCIHLVESDCSDYVVFQAVATMKEGLLREWSIIPLEEKVTLRQYLMTYVIRNTRYIHVQLVSVLLGSILDKYDDY